MESVNQWKHAVRRMSEHLPRFEEVTLTPGLDAIWGNVMFPIVNHAFLTESMDDLRLAAAASCAIEHGTKRQFPWMLCVPDSLVQSTFALHAAGLEQMMRLTYMEAGQLAAPVRPLPDIEFRPIETQEDCEIMADLNSFAYGMPPEWTREACNIVMWKREAYGVVAYAGGAPVSTATALRNDGAINVVCVATAPEHQRQGYAEAAMRKVLAECSRQWSLKRTVLHATDAGYPVYERMGYRPLMKFGLWSPADAHTA